MGFNSAFKGLNCILFQRLKISFHSLDIGTFTRHWHIHVNRKRVVTAKEQKTNPISFYETNIHDNNTKTNSRETDCEDMSWIHLAVKHIHLWGFLQALMKNMGFKKRKELVYQLIYYHLLKMDSV